jgi:hypothetical protein
MREKDATSESTAQKFTNSCKAMIKMIAPSHKEDDYYYDSNSDDDVLVTYDFRDARSFSSNNIARQQIEKNPTMEMGRPRMNRFLRHPHHQEGPSWSAWHVSK